MIHNIMSEFLGTALMIVFGVGVHCDEVLNKTKYRGSGHLFAITTWGFGITIVLLVFGGVCINPAMAFTQAILGMIPIGSIFSEYFAIPRTDDKKTNVSNASTKKFLGRFRIFGLVENIFLIATKSTTSSLALK